MGTDMDKESREFLLEEYKASWEMVRYLSQQRDKWMKYYFTIVAAGFLYIGGALKLSYDKALERDCRLYEGTFSYVFQKIIQNNPAISVSIIFLLILLLIIGVLTFLATIYWRKQSTEYYNALNKFRKFFKTMKSGIQDYIVLPTFEKKAFAEEGVDFYTSILIGILNGVIFLILVFISYFLASSIWAMLILMIISFIIAGMGVHFHFSTYRRILTKHE